MIGERGEISRGEERERQRGAGTGASGEYDLQVILS